MEKISSTEATDILTKVESPECDTVELAECTKEVSNECAKSELNDCEKVESTKSESSVFNQEETSKKDVEKVAFKLVFNKQKLDITWDVNDTVLSLKKHIHSLTNVPPAMQKLMFKGKNICGIPFRMV